MFKRIGLGPNARRALYWFKGVLKRALARRTLQPIWRVFYKTALYGLGYRNSEKRFNGELKFYRDLASDLETRKDRAIVFDVGARHGEVSKLFYHVAEVHAFEPDPRSVDILENNFGSKIIINDVAIADSIGEDVLHFFSDCNMSHFSSLTSGVLEISNHGEIMERKVRVMTLDSYCKEKSVDHIDFLKIDVEGSEKRVLEGAAQMIKNKRIDRILVEISRGSRQAGFCLADVAEILSSYKCYKVLPRGLAPISRDPDQPEWGITEYSNFIFERLS